MFLNLYFTEDSCSQDECFMDCISCDNITLCWLSSIDYGSHVFCLCSDCGGMFVVDCEQNSYDKNWYDLEELITQYPPADRKVEKINNEDVLQDVLHSIKVPLVKVNEIAGSNLSEFFTEYPLDEKEIRKIYEDGIEEYKLKNPDIEFFEECADSDCEKNRLYVTCDSYDITKPAIPYPKNTRIDHDGIVIAFRYFQDGKMKYGYISGD